MRRMPLGLIAAAALFFVTAFSAQSKPNFSGKWVVDETAAGNTGGAGGAGFSCGGACTISQDAATLKVDRAQGDRTFPSTFKLDGTESKNQGPGQGGMTDVVTVAKWDGNKITFTTKRQVQGTAMTSVQTVSMVGATMVVEGLLDRGRGMQPSGKVTYKKQ